ncbi:MAG TPA: reverse transcriptase domain-containing protein [Opitutaceae bacterium]|jgi:retron-type reverse transcriptase|nr:reverse transcriptase domain-containing protein [Opitutaceae bacterium]
MEGTHLDDPAEWVFEGDIKGCFDNISHEWMLTHIPTGTEVLQKWLRAGFVDKRTWFAKEAGTPQGGIISPTLANLRNRDFYRLISNVPVTTRGSPAMCPAKRFRTLRS